MATTLEKAGDTSREMSDTEREEQRAKAADEAGSSLTEGTVELGSYEYYSGSYTDMDWAPEQ